MSLRTQKHGNALDLLEAEELELRRLFTSLQSKRGPSVEERAAYGDLAKEIIRHLATREAALVDVAKVADTDPALSALSERFEASMHQRRPHIDRVEKMSRGVQGMNLRTGQDFDNDMLELIEIVGTEIEWELGRTLPRSSGSSWVATGRTSSRQRNTCDPTPRPTCTLMDRGGGNEHRSSPGCSPSTIDRGTSRRHTRAAGNPLRAERLPCRASSAHRTDASDALADELSRRCVVGTPNSSAGAS